MLQINALVLWFLPIFVVEGGRSFAVFRQKPGHDPLTDVVGNECDLLLCALASVFGLLQADVFDLDLNIRVKDPQAGHRRAVRLVAILTLG